MTSATLICQEREETLKIADYFHDNDKLPRRYKAKRNETDPLVIQILPLHHASDHDSSSLCLGTPEADILPILARSRVSVTEVVTMFLIEVSGSDIVYRSRACAQLIPSLFKSGKCDSCMGLLENIKHLEQFFADESLKNQQNGQKVGNMVIKREEPVMDNSGQIYDDDNVGNSIELDDLSPLEKPLIIQFTKKVELDKMLMLKKKNNKSEGKRSVRCEYCTTKPFTTYKRRLIHMKNKHYDRYIEELLDQGREVYTCPEQGCERRFPSESKLLNHAIKVHNKASSIKEFRTKSRCPFCEQIFLKDSVKLFKHVQVFHFKEADTDVFKKFMQAYDPKLCPHCGSSFHNDRNLTRHLKRCNGLEIAKCHICGKTMKKISLKTHIERQHTIDDVCPCPFCGKIYQNRLQLNDHTKICSADQGRSEEKFECPECGRAFNSMKVLSRHVRRRHENKRNHACDQCGKRFNEIHNLRDHVIAIHDKLKPLICDLCGFKTAKHGNLNIHRQKSHNKPHLSRTLFWQMIQRGEHPYIDNSYEFLDLIKPSRTAVRIYNPQ